MAVMAVFWSLAGVLAAGTAWLVLARARARARRGGAGLDPAAVLHRRHLDELEDLAARGLIAPAELASARAEASRRLLAAAANPSATERVGGRGSRLIVTAVAATAALAAMGLYLVLGAPGAGDQPYAARLKAWRRADPATLDAARLAAVLQALSAERPREPRVFEYLGQARQAAGDAGGAARAFDHAGRLDRANPTYPTEAGLALLEGADGKVSPEAQAAFREAVRRDPKAALARYHLARARIAGGDLAGGVADWRALAAELPVDDPRRASLQAEIAKAAGADLLTAAAPSPSPTIAAMPDAATVAATARTLPAGEERDAFIRGMVARLDARLRARPDDVEGWVRLVRAYRVLGDGPAGKDALARGESALRGRTADLDRLRAEVHAGASASPAR